MIENIIKIVLKAGKVIENGFRETRPLNYNRNIENPSTIVDKKSHQILVEGLKKTGLGPILSEEDNSREAFNFSCQSYWVIDPLDGTREFINKNHEFAISLALIINRLPEIGIVYNPITKELFCAKRGEGAFRNNKRMLLREGDHGTRWLVSRTDCKKGLFKNWAPEQITPMGSIAYKLARAGYEKSCSGVISLTPKSVWDYVGGALIAVETGYDLFDFNGNPLRTLNKLRIENLIAAHPARRDEILKAVHFTKPV
ncbi:MAG: hypothetical protein HYT77_07740 [Deltaproteobacteria bacterium]|nr:hypothetical protein [Deltaproteobacteria bacterium]